MAGEDPSAAATIDKLRFAEFLDQGLSGCHEYWRWPELVPVEKRFFRTAYSASEAYVAGDERYFPATEKYYRALRSFTGQAPAVLVSGAYSTNTSYWWDCSGDIAGEDWAATVAYVVGTVVRNPGDGLYYACHTSHTSSSSFDATKFGELAAFRPFIAYEQSGLTAIEAVIRCFNSDPRSDREAGEVPFRPDAEGVRFSADAEGPVWLEYRKRCPSFAWAAEWSASAFSVDSIVYYPTTGEVYKSSAAAASTDVPGTAAVWVKAEVPYIFRHVAKVKAYALWLEAEGQTDKAVVQAAKFIELLDEQVWQYTKLQGQSGRVRTLVPAN